MKRLSLALLSTLVFANVALAQLNFGASVDAGPKVTLSGALTKKNGDAVEGYITAKIADGWHINSAKPLDDFAIPTVLTLDEATATLKGEPTYPAHELHSFSFSGGKQVAVYTGTIQIPFAATLKAGAAKIHANLRYQSCNDAVCLPPNNAETDIDLTVVAPAAGAGQAGGRPAAAAPKQGTFTPLNAAPKNPVPAGGGDKLAATFASRGLPITLAVLFVLGMALNLTPCVFPLIPITVGFFAMQSDGRRSRRLSLSAMYVAGIVITYSTLGLVAALGGKMFGAWLQLPAVLIGFALLMLILASSMFGAFEIQPPRWIANRSQGRAGLAGAMTMGLVVGIVAAPCVGPVVISLITLVAQIGSPLIGWLMFAALGLGLGFPYLVALNALPRPGEWMVTVKKGMGFVLVAMAFYFLRSLTGDTIFRVGVAASLLIGAFFLFFSRSKGARVMRLSVASLLLVAGAAFAIPPRKGVEVSWTKYDAAALVGTKKPVIIDFYADWCLPCKEMDEKTFNDPRVAKELDRFTRVKADLTFPDKALTKELTEKYAIKGVPTYIFLDANGQEIPELRYVGFEPPEKFLARLKQVP